jgi:putative ABC transport system substrate-binding protein
MRRREFITQLGGAAAAWPLAARAQQQPAVPLVGYLGPGSAEGSVAGLAAFRKGLAETGFVEGQNVEIDYRWASGENNRLRNLRPH